ncbi:hypothetical protein Plec18167_001888 [Paecilomyces lecythidis]|uniref:BHLH domain-containing protein n=1 Tax=Paecilomyces lecythidis TaxID=3004212 RepID=A0ABR3YAA0_9EURO
MSLQHQHPISTGKKRLAEDPTSESRKRAKAERERFRRGKHDAFKKLNDLFLNSLASGRERRVYAIVMNKSKDIHGTIRYSTYNSHPHEHWIPLPEEVGQHWPRSQLWEPENFRGAKETLSKHGGQPRSGVLGGRRLFTVSQPPLLGPLKEQEKE